MGYRALVNGRPRHHRYAGVQRIMGILLMVFSLTMLPPLAMDIFWAEETTTPFLGGMWITLTTGALLWWPVRHERSELKVRDGFLITTLFWAVLGLFGAIPFYFADEGWHSITESVFESVSGLTTTGSTTIAQGLDELPHSLKYYRSQLHWLGGMGIVVLAVAVLPMLGVGGMGLYKAETPGPMKDSKLTPRITSTARALWMVYLVLTIACGLAFWWAGMTPFDALCHAFSTIANGGFSTHDNSIGHYGTLRIELVAMFFMLVGATNFALHYTAFTRRNLGSYFRDGEFRVFLSLYLGMGILVCLPLVVMGPYPDALTAIRHGMFQVIAFGTTAGFATDNPTSWPVYVPLLLVMCTFMMCSGGSTGGGVKVVRLMLFVRQAFRELKLLVHPNAEVAIKLDGKVVPNDVVYAVGGFFSVYIGMTLALTGLMLLTGMDGITAFSAVAASINNAGPGLGEVNANVASVSAFGKWVMIFAMLAGRLEVFTLLVLFTPAFWRR
ncbi:potassium transporter TrkG [Solimonas sp. SE-A11]|uniref:potassium transporter TrkG n=1 Tax=Solimonas sp. SE-A11 TaxID=3054954 RepID=UPI00259D05C1|nr:potassium transporter TrkG [Solimonas sp. SE-A11]